MSLRVTLQKGHTGNKLGDREAVNVGTAPVALGGLGETAKGNEVATRGPQGHEIVDGMAIPVGGMTTADGTTCATEGPM